MRKGRQYRMQTQNEEDMRNEENGFKGLNIDN